MGGKTRPLLNKGGGARGGSVGSCPAEGWGRGRRVSLTLAEKREGGEHQKRGFFEGESNTCPSLGKDKPRKRVTMANLPGRTGGPGLIKEKSLAVGKGRAFEKHGRQCFKEREEAGGRYCRVGASQVKD